jgi:mono/diheme cytochrome c family protein
MRTGALEFSLIASLLAGAGGCESPGRSKGEVAFERNCGACHAAAKLPAARASDLTDPQKRIALDQFLARHHAPDVKVRSQIIDYLATQEK